jgi:uncharacterized lipoprotein YddW (UPF0748 family)
MRKLKEILQQCDTWSSTFLSKLTIIRVDLPVIIVILALLVNFNAMGQSLEFKVRALWVDPSGFGTAEAVNQMISKCQRAGINTILPDVMVHGTVYFKSPHFQGPVSANDKFDPLGYMVTRAHAAGIKVQAWSCVYYEGRGTPRKSEWVSKSFDRNPPDQIFLSPGNPEVNPYLLSVLKDLLAYDLDGIHLDYTRYCNAAFDYSDGAREGCQTELGFDPLNLLDHPELIIPAEKDPFPIRVLHPKTQIEKVWEIGAVERNLNRTGVGFAFISESPQNIDALRSPGLLIISHYTDVSPEMATAIKHYVDRGGNILWIDISNAVLTKYPELLKLTGLKGTRWLPQTRVSLQRVEKHPVSKFIPTHIISTSGNLPQVAEAKIIARLSTGEPAISINQVDKSKVMVMGIRAMESNADSIILLLKGVMTWYRTEAGVEGTDLLAEKRNRWIKWRVDHVDQLVRDFNKAVKDKNSKILVTSSAGVGPQQYYGCYRDGATWLTEKINDCLFPMNYTPDPIDLEDILQEQEKYIPHGKMDQIYPGLQMYVVKNKIVTSLDASIVERQLLIVKQKGYQGYCLFAYNTLSDEIILMLKKFNK